MVVHQTVNLQFRVRSRHLSSPQGHVSVTLLGSQQGWHDNCRFVSEGRKRKKKKHILRTQNGVNAVILSLDQQLCHHDHVLGVHRAVRDPVLLRQRVRGVHNEFWGWKTDDVKNSYIRYRVVQEVENQDLKFNYDWAGNTVPLRVRRKRTLRSSTVPWILHNSNGRESFSGTLSYLRHPCFKILLFK